MIAVIAASVRRSCGNHAEPTRLATALSEEPMALYSIEYLNARRDSKPASGGKTYVRRVNPVDRYCQLAALDTHEKIMSEIDETLDDIRRSVAALHAHAQSFDMVAATGESVVDLWF
jgi:hypothetical protein